MKKSRHSDVLKTRKKSKKSPTKSTRFPTGADILRRKLPPIATIIEDILVQGLTFLAGTGKLGKSTMAWQMAGVICTPGGGTFLGREVDEGQVLYLSLEEYADAIKERMVAQGWTKEMSANITVIDPMDFRDEIGPLHTEGAAERLVDVVRDGDYRLVVIDSFEKAFLGMRKQDSSEVVTFALEPLHSLANTQKFCLLIIDHHGHNRGIIIKGTDPVDDIMSSSAKGHVADTAIGFYPDGPQGRRMIKVRGRRLPEKILRLSWDAGRRLYDVIDEEAVPLTPRQRKIRKWLRHNGPATLTETAEGTGISRGNLHPVLKAMVDRDVVDFLEEAKLYNA